MHVYNNDIPANHPYLTAGKRYPVAEWADRDTVRFLGDTGENVWAHIPASGHLDGAPWTVTHD